MRTGSGTSPHVGVDQLRRQLGEDVIREVLIWYQLPSFIEEVTPVLVLALGVALLQQEDLAFVLVGTEESSCAD
eukprot:CAMPEP_0194771650 /NCGR_PEP_ID=MMETSP0323_2-20130528/49804_1 /TAXON_ID=2866 ORGANISM="Crypthecodinium cohnii, Strain Seligo" /NCGR_SAMPLE_ID=MMETSP0323_2 /ASSEMBLY_ACC=CAM_ASM_000346 /LENGTH=73 /DNA_ID=CAMNT_0039705851 /DNA_START=304 /DNA_END=525 /DNA_ORIENTATION=-